MDDLKKSKVDEALEALAEGVKELFNSETYEKYLFMMSKFPHYSARNTLLIQLQRPDAELICGYQEWQRTFHRFVKKGEKSITILAPCPYKKWVYTDKVDDKTGDVIRNADGTPQKESKQIIISAFKPVSVFDISQTDGDPLPTLGVSQLEGDVAQYDDLMEALKRTSPVPISFENIEGSAKGYFSPGENRIVIRKGMEQLQTVKTVIHELTHSLLHGKEASPVEGVTPCEKDRMTQEVEAESTAFVVSKYFGFDTSEYSFGYIAGWSSGKEAKELLDSLDTIRLTAHHTIGRIEAELCAISEERQERELTQLASEIAELLLPAEKMSTEEIRKMIVSGDVTEILVSLGNALVESYTSGVTEHINDVVTRLNQYIPEDGDPERTQEAIVPRKPLAQHL
ncbi:MAG: ssDNA-binding domain-containing protein [Lachnospiraceae bacterium]|nr:ssDNA-binding domain-containing protein [Lachnospiraceae bacterium]